VRKEGGWIVASRPNVDRDKDRVMPMGIDLAAYQRNPVIMFGHVYNQPWAVLGRAAEMRLSPESFDIRPELREPVNDSDPMTIIRSLWEADLLRAASIGFIPKKQKPNSFGGVDFDEIELLEISLVPIPANQEALRLAMKGLMSPGDAPRGGLWDTEAVVDPGTRSAAEGGDTPLAGRAWVRRLSVESGRGKQTLFAVFYRWDMEVPEDATLLEFDPVLGGCEEKPHPEAGKTVTFKQAVFVPPLEFSIHDVADAAYTVTRREAQADQAGAQAAAVAADLDWVQSDYWEVLELSDVVASIAPEKAWQARPGTGFEMPLVTRRAVSAAEKLGRRLAKRGRVLSRKNEEKIVVARDNLNEVLAEVQADAEGVEDRGSDDTDKALLAKDALPPHDSPKADPDTAWDGPEVVAGLPNEEAVLRRVHAWVDSEADPDTKQAYKFPHHFEDGRVVLRGVNNAMARLPQATLPDADRAGVERHLRRHQEQFEQEESSDGTRSPSADAILLDADSERYIAEHLHELVSTLEAYYGVTSEKHV
jgi:hypothetical protein